MVEPRHGDTLVVREGFLMGARNFELYSTAGANIVETVRYCGFCGRFTFLPLSSKKKDDKIPLDMKVFFLYVAFKLQDHY